MTGIGSYDEIAARRYARVESRPDGFALRLAPRILRLFDGQRPTRTPTMLDIGCGTGQLTDFFRAAGFATVGIDRAEAMLRHRVDDRSGHRGPVAVADASALPLAGRFDLITATFNVFNHLPNHAAAAALVDEVARVLAPNGRFVFDINTTAGLRYTAELVETHTGADDVTTWTRRWSDGRLVLDASGAFVDDDGNWVRYEERIVKIAITIADIEGWFAAAGLGPPRWLSDDLITALHEPEQHGVAYGVAGSAPIPDAAEAAAPAVE